MTSLRQRVASERGAELIEFALIVPMLLLVMLGIADFGFMFQRYEVLTNAAREGARIAVLPGYSDADVITRVTGFLSAGGVPVTGAAASPTNPVVTVTNVSVALPVGTALQAKRVQVTFTHSYMFIGPIAGMFSGTFNGTVPITARAVMRNEIQSGP